MICKNCKKEIPDGSNFCNWCGYQQVKIRDQIKIPPPAQRNGNWHGRITVDGKRISITEPSQELYYVKARAYKVREQVATETPNRITLGQMLDDYIEEYTPVLSPCSIRGYKTYAKQLEAYRDQPIGKLDWQKMINYYSRKYAPKSIRNMWGLISVSLKSIGEDVPNVKLPAKEPSNRGWLDYKQIPLFLDAIKDEPCELACLLALHSLRVSEIFALNKNSIVNGTIRVRGAAVLDENNKLVQKKSNKNETSTRDIPIMIPRLEEIWDYDNDPKFNSQSAINRGIAKACVKIGAEPMTIHCLRHSFCSLARQLQWDIKTTCKIGGWKNEKVPSDIYSHIPTSTELKSIECMRNYYT